MSPMTNAAHGSTDAHPAVMATRPARIPFVKAWKSNLISFFSPVMCFLVEKVRRPEAAGAITELMIALSASLLDPLAIAADEPALKNNHPSQRMRVPRTAYCGE